MNETPKVLLLPGLDGTGHLFNRLVVALEPSARAQIVRYPGDRFLRYDELADLVRAQAPVEPYAIVAESFSGPIAALVASHKPKALRGIILFASFVAPPAPRILRGAPLALLVRFGLSAGLVRLFLLESTTGPDIVTDTLDVIRTVSPALLAARLRQVLCTDASRALRSCSVPVVYVVGANDKLLGKRGFRGVRSAIPDIEVVTLEGPHLLLQARSQECATVISKYLRRWFAS